MSRATGPAAVLTPAMQHDHAVDPTATQVWGSGHNTIMFALVSIAGDIHRFEVPPEAAARMAQRIMDAVTAERTQHDPHWRHRHEGTAT